MVINLENSHELEKVKSELLNYCGSEDLEKVSLHITTADNYFTPVLADYAGLNHTYYLEELVDYLLRDIHSCKGGHVCIWCEGDHIDHPMEISFYINE